MRTRHKKIKTLLLLVFTALMSHSLSTHSARAADPDLMGWWSMDNEVDGMVLDSSGNGRHGTLHGAPAFVAGVHDGAIELFGGPDYVTIDGYQGVLGANAFSIAAWVQTSNTATQQITHWGTHSGGQRVEFRIDGSRLRISHGNGNVQGDTTIPDGEWYHVVAAVVENASASSGDVTFYVNGVDDTQEKTDPDVYNVVSGFPITIGWRPTQQDRAFAGVIDDVAVYSRALTAEEIPSIMAGLSLTTASSPLPSDEAGDVPRDVVLEWSPGDDAAKHNIYLSTVFEDVSNADAANTLGALASQEQEGTTYTPDSVLEFGQTYYWRVDEVNAAPDNTVFRGDVWSFSVEPLSRPITNIAATASSSFGVSVPENTINGSGLVDDLHGIAASDMWISAAVPATIEYAFDRVYKLHELWIWNSNQTIEAFVGFGAKDIVIEHSLDGEIWTVLKGVSPLAQAPGTEGYAANNMINFGGATARHVRVTINSVQGIAPQASLSEVRFLYIPTYPTGPNPVSGATDVAADATLSWDRDGREAARHDIFLGSDPSVLSLAGSVQESHFDTLAADLQVGQTYYWQVVEVNDAMDPTEWAGEVWSFSTVGGIVVDDMESYRDEEFLEIWATWIDGFDDPGNNGAIVGAVPSLGDFAPETTIVNGGGQSLPIHFDNSGAPRSEATRTFDATMDWGKHGVQSLILSFHGSLTNTGGRLYVKINDTQVAYDGDPADLQRIGFHKWTIDLATLPDATRSAVNSLTIGIDSGGAGVIYIDDIRLTPETRELITPAELSPEGLVAYYPFDGDFQDASGNGRHGTGMGGALGGPVFEPGQSGQAILLDGAGQYVEITGYQGISAVDGVQQPFSISNWFKTVATGDAEMVTWGNSPGGERLSWRLDLGSLRAEHGNGNLIGNTLVNDGEWHHGALVVQEGANLRVPGTTLYIDGLADGVNGGDDDLYNLTPGENVSIGRRATSNDRFFAGSIDEVRIFDRALSAAEVAGLAGRTEPFEKP